MPVKITLSPQLKVTTQMVLSSHLLRLPELDLEQAIARELVDNPALERVESDWYYTHRHQGPTADDNGDDSDLTARVPARESGCGYLINQARLLVPHNDFAPVIYLIHSLDEHGFLTTPREELARALNLSHDALDRAINWLQQLDPPGIGAYDVHECLSLQCRALESHDLACRTIRKILDQAWEPFTRQRWQLVVRATACSLPEVHAAVCFMRERFYLFPLLLVPILEDEAPPFDRPDLIVRRSIQGGDVPFTIEVPAANMDLCISPPYHRATITDAASTGALSLAERVWIQDAVERARRFIDALEQRYATLRLIGEFLVTYQANFFAAGPRHLKPLTRVDAARLLGIHPSTVSRAVSDKILQLPDGRLMELGKLFDTSLAAREAIRELVATNSESLSDREIAARLRHQSFALSRRTVAQYRDELGIPGRSHRTRGQLLGNHHAESPASSPPHRHGS